MANRQINTWKNHEDSFEETLRREMLAEKTQRFLLQEDLKQLTASYYKVLLENTRLKGKRNSV